MHGQAWLGTVHALGMAWEAAKNTVFGALLGGSGLAGWSEGTHESLSSRGVWGYLGLRSNSTHTRDCAWGLPLLGCSLGSAATVCSPGGLEW